MNSYKPGTGARDLSLSYLATSKPKENRKKKTRGKKQKQKGRE